MRAEQVLGPSLAERILGLFLMVNLGETVKRNATELFAVCGLLLRVRGSFAWSSDGEAANEVLYTVHHDKGGISSTFPEMSYFL
jgi:hypothetical protein